MQCLREQDASAIAYRYFWAGLFFGPVLFALLWGISSLPLAFLGDDLSLVQAGRHMMEDDFWRPFTGPWVWPDIAPHWPHYNYFRPLVILSFGLDYLLWGYNPAGYHLANGVIHALCTALAGGLAFSLFGKRHYPVALFAAFLFAMHPIHEFNVFWLSGRTDSLCTLFYLASALCFLRLLRARRVAGWFAAVLALGSLALMSKEMAYTLPFACFLLYWVMIRPVRPYHIWVWQGAGYLLPVFGLAAVFLAWRFAVFGWTGAMHGDGLGFEPGRALWMMTRHLVLPFHVSFKALARQHTVLFVGSALLVAAAFLPLLCQIRRRTILLPLGWIAITLLPVFNFFMPWYMYLPSVGFALGLGWVLGAAGRGRRLSLLGFALFLLVMGAYAVQMQSRLRAWGVASQTAGRVVSQYLDRMGGPGTYRPVFLCVPGIVDGVPVYTHNLPARLRMETGDPALSPILCSYAAYPRAIEDHGVVFDYLGRTAFVVWPASPKAFFVFPDYPPGTKPPWGRVEVAERNARGLPNRLNLWLETAGVEDWPIYLYDRGELRRITMP